MPKRGETAHFGTILIHFVRAGRWRPSRPFWNVSNCLRNRHYAEVSRAARGRDIAVSSPTHMPSTMKLGALTFKSPSVYVLFKGKQPGQQVVRPHNAPPLLRTSVPDSKASSSVCITCGLRKAATATQAAAQPGPFRLVSSVRCLN